MQSVSLLPLDAKPTLPSLLGIHREELGCRSQRQKHPPLIECVAKEQTTSSGQVPSNRSATSRQCEWGWERERAPQALPLPFCLLLLAFSRAPQVPGRVSYKLQ